MAVVGVLEDKGSVLRKRKRGRIRKKKKLDVNDKVEVRSVDDGFQGSWHQGTIISLDKQACHVKYDNILADDGSVIVDIVAFSPVDGIDCRYDNQCNYRGSLRPLPPKREFNQWNLCYGLCVDVYYMEAWWEGVIFDHEDGSEKRRVFFPDLGDEMLAEIGNLRITQDWDDFEEKWHQRGTWLFLEVIEEYEKEWYISVSVKQLWYDLREKKGFQNVREWTSSCAALWKELVLEVIKDNQEITVDHFLRVSGLPGSSQPESKSQPEPAMPVADVNMSYDDFTNIFGLEPAVPVANVDMSSDADLADTFSLVLVENPIINAMTSSNSASIQPYQEKSDAGQLIHILKDDNNILTEFNGISLDKAISVVPEAFLVPPSVADRISCISSVTSTEGFPETDLNMAKRRARSSKLNATSTWMTAGKDVVPKAESCPDALIKYALAGKKNKNALKLDARKHLLYQGWKIESKRDNCYRVRYISPAGDCYYSLYKLCLDFMEHSGKLISSNTQGLHVVEANTKDVHVVKPKTTDLHVVEPKTQDYVVEPEYCPQAVLHWSKAELDEIRCPSRRNDMTLNAKKHLSWKGWRFHYENSKGRRFLCYISPRGRKYNSLRTACKICLKEEEEITQTDASPSRHVETTNVIDANDSQLQSEKLSTALSNMAVPRTPEPSNAKSENWSRESYEFDMTDLVELSTVGQGTQKPKRKRKDSSLYFASLLGKTRANLPVENTSISRTKGGKTPAALFKLREKLKGCQRNGVIRSTKRVQQVVSPSPLHKNPRTVLSWLIDNNVVLPRSKVHCGRKEQKLKLEGRITRHGIKCSCCNNVYTVGGFVAHAGGTSHKSASKIFLEDGRSLLDCQLEMLHNNKMKKFEKKRNCRLKGNQQQDRNDCVCSVCHYGGELILCDQCPSSFHKSCLGLETVPDGDWFCPSCCCGICGESKAKEDGEGSVVSCAQCEHKYHAVCICSGGTNRLEICAKENWFCSKKCEEIFVGLHELLGRPIPVGTDNLTWTLIKSMKSDTHDLDASDNEAMVENYSKLSIALDVMHECFEPVKEPHTGRDLVADIIFCRSSELNRLNFQGFYTILLEREDELITVANVRVHGEKVAEVPLIGTRFQYRRLGMCRILMNELEKKLVELGVEKLILPAVPSVLRTWTTSFGFSKMMPLERLKFVDYTFLDFQGAIMCQKLLLERRFVESKLSIGSQIELHNVAFHSNDNVHVDGSSAVSEVLQAGQTEENGFMDQGLLEIDAGGQIISNETIVAIVAMENQPTQVDHEPFDSLVNPESSVEDGNSKEEKCGTGIIKYYYRRRRISASGG